MSVFALLKKQLITAERALSVGELRIAQGIFTHQIDYSTVRICASRLVLPGYAICPNGKIYFHPQDYCSDFNVQDLLTQSWFIHEMTHVWQYQQGIAVVQKALLNRRYNYVLRSNKAFLSYGVEQQARMVQDYFLKRARGQACDDLAACIPFVAVTSKR